MNTRSHRQILVFLFVIVLLIAGLLSACSAAIPGTDEQPGEQESAQGGASDGNLVILDWPGYDAPSLWAKFAEAYPDVSVETSYFEQDADALAKLQSGFSVDLVHPCSSWWGLYVDAGLVQPIDTSKLSTWADISPEMAKLGEFDGVQYFVPYDWGYESILVRSDKVDEIPTSWADLWNPAYAGRVSVQDSGEVTFLTAAIALGIPDPWNTTPEQDEMIKQKLIELKPNLLTYWVDSTELSQMIASGDVWVASNVWQDTYGLLQDEGVAVEYIQPAEGRLGWVCGYGISSQAEDVDLAHAYIDAILDPEASANLGTEFWYGSANTKAAAYMPSEVVEMFRLDDPDMLSQTVFYKTMTAENREKITSTWDEVKIAP